MIFGASYSAFLFKIYMWFTDGVCLVASFHVPHLFMYEEA